MPRQLCGAGTDAAEPIDKTTRYSRRLSERSAVLLHVRRLIRYRCQSSCIRSFCDPDLDLAALCRQAIGTLSRVSESCLYQEHFQVSAVTRERNTCKTSGSTLHFVQVFGG